MAAQPHVAPGARPCAFLARGWSCGGTGYLWIESPDRPARTDYPCPRCNTRTFLETALRRARRHGTVGCPCCGDGLGKDGALAAALAVARTENSAAAEDFLNAQALNAQALNAQAKDSAFKRPRFMAEACGDGDPQG